MLLSKSLRRVSIVRNGSVFARNSKTRSITSITKPLLHFAPSCKGGVTEGFEPNLEAFNYKMPSSLPPVEYLKQEIKKFDPNIPIAKAFTPPSSWYTDPLFLRLESKAVFHSNYVQVGRRDQLKNPGDYISGSLLGEPYIVVLDENHQLRGFFNICRHHASRLVGDGVGCVNEFVCPYHGWTYTLDGKLRKATQIKGIQDFRASNYGLKPIDVQTFGPWIFCKIGGNPTWDPMQSLLDILQSTKYEELEFVKSTSYTVNCNWKVYIDNYCDGGYHVPYLHKSLDEQIDMSSYETKLHKNYSLQIAHGKHERIGGTGAYYAYLYPNFMINRYGNAMDTNLVIPITPNKTLVRFDYFFKKGEKVEESMKISDEIQKEDEFVSERVQEGLNSSGYEVGRYAPNVEMAEHHFHKLLYEDYLREVDK